MVNWMISHLIKNCENVQDINVRAQYGKLAGTIGIICNILLAGGKAAVGILTASISILADAVNNLSDAASSIVTLIGFKLSAKPSDKEHPFGHARVEYIAGMITSFVILLVGVELIRSSVDKIINPVVTEYSTVSVIILAVSILAKLWMMFFYNTVGIRIDSEALYAAAADSRFDVITTCVVLVSMLIAHITGWELDAWAGLIVSLFIIWGGIGLIRETASPLLGKAPDDKLVKHIKSTIENHNGVLGTHDLIVHDYGPGRKFASVHVEMDSSQDPMKSHDIIDSLERYFLENDGLNLLIHYDPIIIGDKKIDAARGYATKAVKSVNESYSLHDFRMTEHPEHITYTFDVVVPSECSFDTEELQRQIEQAVQHGSKPIRVIITVDQNYLSQYPASCREKHK